MSIKQKVEQLTKQMDLTKKMAQDLLGWYGTEIVVIADDSGSMRAVADRENCTTRWNELQARLRELLHIALFVDDEGGYELRYLNYGQSFSIHNSAALEASWPPEIKYKTPMLKTLRPYLNYSDREEHDRLIIVITDGEPSDGTFAELKSLIEAKGSRVFVSFLMCTDEDAIMQQYDECMDGIDGVDVNDDYLSEAAQVSASGNRLSKEAYLIKCILGPKLPGYDNLDEMELPSANSTSSVLADDLGQIEGLVAVDTFLADNGMSAYRDQLVAEGVTSLGDLQYLDAEILGACGVPRIKQKRFLDKVSKLPGSSDTNEDEDK